MSGLRINDSPSKYNSPSTYYNSDDRQLSGTGSYDLTYARNDFDIEEDFEEVVEAKEDKQELREVVRNY